MAELQKISDADDDCPRCKGEGWVCESHEQIAWGDGDGCGGGAGAPCICNPLHKHGRSE